MIYPVIYSCDKHLEYDEQEKNIELQLVTSHKPFFFVSIFHIKGLCCQAFRGNLIYIFRESIGCHNHLQLCLQDKTGLTSGEGHAILQICKPTTMWNCKPVFIAQLNARVTNRTEQQFQPFVSYRIICWVTVQNSWNIFSLLLHLLDLKNIHM